MRDMLVIPTDEAKLALDLVASQMMIQEEDGVTMNNSSEYGRLKNLYTFHGIKSKFANLVLQSVKVEGRRKMFERQPIHIRCLATTGNEIDIGIEDCK